MSQGQNSPFFPAVFLSKLRLCSLFAAACFAGCSLQTPAPPAKPVTVPVFTESDAAAATPPLVPLNLRPPLLSDARLGEVSRAFERGDESKAFSMFEQAINHLAADAPELPHWHLSLGYTYQKRANPEAALSHFQVASQWPWMLREYATLGLAQCHLALGHTAYARQLVEAIHAEPPLADDVQLFRAELFVQLGQPHASIEILRTYLKAHTTPSSERTRVSFQLAELLAASELTNTTSDASANLVDASDSSSVHESLKEAWALLDPTDSRDLDRATLEKYHALKASIISKLFAGDTNQKQECSIRNQAEELGLLVERRDFKRVLAVAETLVPDLERNMLLDSADGCRVRFARAQAHLSSNERAKGNSELGEIAKRCSAPEDVVARSLYSVARRCQDGHDLPQAIAGFEELEKRFPKNRLVDDARLRIAFAYLELGSESRFTECIQRLAEDLPESDSAAEGLFQLALRAMTKSDWSGAASVLAQLGRLPKIANHDYVEHAERQLFFLARAQQQLGQTNEALARYESLIRERPFCYYMLSAYSRMLEVDRERAVRVRAASTVDSGSLPFSVPYQPQFDKPGYARAMELMALGEIQRGAEELQILNLPKELQPLLLWSQASFEATAGALKNSQRLVRERLRDWPRRWPAGAWEPAWKVAFPQPFLDIVARESKRSGVPSALIYAIMREESQFDREAVSQAAPSVRTE